MEYRPEVQGRMGRRPVGIDQLDRTYPHQYQNAQQNGLVDQVDEERMLPQIGECSDWGRMR